MKNCCDNKFDVVEKKLAKVSIDNIISDITTDMIRDVCDYYKLDVNIFVQSLSMFSISCDVDVKNEDLVKMSYVLTDKLHKMDLSLFTKDTLILKFDNEERIIAFGLASAWRNLWEVLSNFHVFDSITDYGTDELSSFRDTLQYVLDNFVNYAHAHMAMHDLSIHLQKMNMLISNTFYCINKYVEEHYENKHTDYLNRIRQNKE